ncbi:MAG: CfrBI family restriction endonuclease [Anaerolineae bacterium]|nr:CfrBI family restriction endonuclease [Anaerolineae bacterium]
MPKSKDAPTLSSFLSEEQLGLLSATGKDLIPEIGLEVVRGVVLDVLCGRNLRDSTEMLTRRRIAALNLATVNLFVKGSAQNPDFVRDLPRMAAQTLSQRAVTKADKWLAQWILGLTGKAFQNVLRDDATALEHYRERYIETCQRVIANHESAYGALRGTLQIDPLTKAQVNWLWMTYLLNTIGAQALAIRGSEKSTYGKLFEKLILGSLLHILGFKFTTYPPATLDKVFWLASKDEKRESDATLIFQAGKGARFDIGFIGRGNPEISLDKVSRFEREISLGRSKFFLATLILVDRIGESSNIETLARSIDGTIIQMSASYWPQLVAKELSRVVGFKHPLINMPLSKIEAYLRDKLRNVPLMDFVETKKTDAEED